MPSGICKRNLKPIIKAGDKYNRLTAIKFSHKAKTNQHWLFKCDCGNEKIISVSYVKSGATKSCGCLRKNNGRKIIHGKTGTKIYKCWCSMKRRCLDKNRKDYKHYGGRGITVCHKWLKFINFYKDMGEKPKGLTLDRIDNNGDYCKENCRWATRKEQQNNRRDNYLITYKGKTQTINQWAERLGISRGVIFWRIKKGWSIKKTLENSVKKKK